MSAPLPRVQDGAVLAGIKAMPSGWPPASLDPGCRRHRKTASGSRSSRNHKFRSLRFQGIAGAPHSPSCSPPWPSPDGSNSAPAGRPRSWRTARRYRTIEIQAATQTITAADPHATTCTKRSNPPTATAEVRTNLTTVGSELGSSHARNRRGWRSGTRLHSVTLGCEL
jgi:hypothetical protein